MIRAVITDDEVLARQKLHQLLRSEPDIEIVGECATARETVELVCATNPDLLFLDIRMPDMDGFDVIGALTSRKEGALPHVVFTTAYDQFAVRAFEVHAIDYLLKPFTVERLRSSIERMRSLASKSGEDGAANPRAETADGGFISRIVFKSRGRILFLPTSDIHWIGAEENYVRVNTGRESHLLRETMSNLEKRLDPKVFLRVHRSFIVNLHFVKEIRTSADGESVVALLNDEKVAMSRTYRARIQELIHR
jgi:two-component system, LytTR family, response regulator